MPEAFFSYPGILKVWFLFFQKAPYDSISDLSCCLKKKSIFQIEIFCILKHFFVI